MNNLTPELRVDKNGNTVTRHVRTGAPSDATAKRVAGVDIMSSFSPTDYYEPQSREEWAETPNDIDYEESMIDVIHSLSGMKGHYDRSWERVMGHKTRRSAGNVAEFERLQREYIEKSAELMNTVDSNAHFNAEMKSYSRAYLTGVEDEKEGELFEQIWSGKTMGTSEQDARKSLAEYTQMRDDLAEGRITPTSVIGSGYRNPKKVAYEWVERQVGRYYDAIETRGRSLPVNVSNVGYRIRDAQRDSEG